jgi:hypothetical protein
MGEDPYKHVFIKLLVGEHITWSMIVITLLMFFNVGTVIWRQDNISQFLKVIIIAALALYQINNNFERLNLAK